MWGDRESTRPNIRWPSLDLNSRREDQFDVARKTKFLNANNANYKFDGPLRRDLQWKITPTLNRDMKSVY